MAEKFLKIKKLLFCFVYLALFPAIVFAQDLNKNQINLYAKQIDQLKVKKKLTKYFYPNKSRLGALYGFYLDGKLVYIEAIHGGDQLENRYVIYLKDSKIYKVISKSYRYTKLNRKRISILGNTEIFYPNELATGNLLEAIKVSVEDLEQGKF